MTAILAAILGRMPLGWLQLSHSKTRLFAAVAGVAFANVLVFVQMGMLGALTATTAQPYNVYSADIMISAADSNTLSDGGNVPRQYMLRALSLPGIEAGTPLFIGKLDWQITDRRSSAMTVMALPVNAAQFVNPDLRPSFSNLSLPDTAIVDVGTRGGNPDLFKPIRPSTPVTYELNNRRIRFVDTMNIGAGFTSDGNLLMSDQTFLNLFGNRSSAAPNHLLLKTDGTLATPQVVELLKEILPTDILHIRSIEQAMADNTSYQTTERPVGVIFGLGIAVGVLVGLVIVYQVLSTDVADHIKEYATFKAMGYSDIFFLSVIFEEALILAVFGFIPGMLVASGFYQIIAIKSGLPVAMTLGRAVLVFVGTLIACSVSGAIATRRLARADPADLF